MVVDKMSMIYEALLELHAEMVLDEAIRQFQEQKLYEGNRQGIAETGRTLIPDVDRAVENVEDERKRNGPVTFPGRFFVLMSMWRDRIEIQ